MSSETVLIAASVIGIIGGLDMCLLAIRARLVSSQFAGLGVWRTVLSLFAAIVDIAAGIAIGDCLQKLDFNSESHVLVLLWVVAVGTVLRSSLWGPSVSFQLFLLGLLGAMDIGAMIIVLLAVARIASGHRIESRLFTPLFVMLVYIGLSWLFNKTLSLASVACVALLYGAELGSTSPSLLRQSRPVRNTEADF